MKIVLCLLVLCTLHAGCRSSYIVSSSLNPEQSFAIFNMETRRENFTIVFRDGKKIPATSVVAAPDSTSFLDVTTGARLIVATPDIEKVVSTSGGIGFLEGFGFGFLAGGAYGRLATKSGDFGYAWNAMVCGILGGIPGGIVGLIIRHRYEYRFEASADSTKPH